MSDYAFGWLPDLPDLRDRRFAAPRAAAVPDHIDRRPEMPPVYDQGPLGSCTAQAIAAAMQVGQRRQGLEDFTSSRLFIYWYERLLLNPVLVFVDSGARIRDGLKVVNRQGAPHEALWPYDIANFRRMPPLSTSADARRHQAIGYARVESTSIGDLRTCLATSGPIVIGFTVYESFMGGDVAQTGIVPMPTPDEPTVGGHAILLCGYDDAAQRFIFRNSWGAGWGDAGYGTIPWAYIGNSDLAADAWTITRVEASAA